MIDQGQLVDRSVVRHQRAALAGRQHLEVVEAVRPRVAHCAERSPAIESARGLTGVLEDADPAVPADLFQPVKIGREALDVDGVREEIFFAVSAAERVRVSSASAITGTAPVWSTARAVAM